MAGETKEKKDLQTMADLLRQGARLTNLSCPACSSPLFKLRTGKLWCGQCQKRVIVVKEGEAQTEAAFPMALSKLEATILSKIKEIEKRIEEENDLTQLEKLVVILSTLLENLGKIRRMKR